jgi:hypothetical protein
MAVAWVLVALVERASAREAALARAEEEGEEAPTEIEPEPQPVYSGPAREWSVWDLQRIVRDRPDDPRQEEWAALVLMLRDYARADGTLPPEFDELVRESFGALLATETAAAP